MQIIMLRKFWFGEQYYNDTDEHRHYHTIRFANRPNIDAQIWLTIFSSGATYRNGAVTALGAAAAGIKSFAFVNDRGDTEVKVLSEWTSNIRVERAVHLTVAFSVKLAWAKAEGMIYYWV